MRTNSSKRKLDFNKQARNYVKAAGPGGSIGKPCILFKITKIKQTRGSCYFATISLPYYDSETIKSNSLRK